MDINLELYKVFYTVAQEKNITKASKELMIRQPGVSKSIKKLETSLGCNLFNRSKSGVELTNEGKILYKQIKQAMELINNVEIKIKNMINLDSGYLSIGASKTITEKYLLPYIKYFNHKYPNIKIDIHTEQTHKLIAKARNGIIDFIILNLPYNTPNDFKTIKLKEIHDCFTASKKYIELKNKRVPLEELKKYPLIIIAKGSNTRNFLDNYCQSQSYHIKPSIEPTSISLVESFTKIGMGIGYNTLEYIKDDIEKEIIFKIDTTFNLPNRYIGLIYMQNKKFNCSATEFIKILQEKKI